VWGGIHPTLRPDECLEYADWVCIGEGERAAVDLARCLVAGRDARSVPNLAWLDDAGGLVRSPLHPLEANLDTLPFPDYDIKDHFVLHEGRLVPFSPELMHYYLLDLGSWARGPVYGVATSRGCPYHCAYCANSALAQLYPGWCQLRRRSVDSVIAEIRAVRARLPGIEAIAIRDDTFLALPAPYVEEFSRRYRVEVGLPFRVYTTAATADPAKLRALVGAGMRMAIMGIQSGSPRIQALYERPISNAQVLRAAQVLHSLRPSVPRPMYDVITDNPYETTDDRFQTLRIVHALPRPYRLSLFSLTFYPGTALCERAHRDGLIGDESEALYRRNFQQVRAGFYNLALFCHGLNLPRPLLWLLSRRPVFDLASRGWLDRAGGWVLGQLLAWRLRRNEARHRQKSAHQWRTKPTP
jgi:anaerobic magnesium-protoporphyrin IX monomethyl ester cyclase